MDDRIIHHVFGSIKPVGKLAPNINPFFHQSSQEKDDEKSSIPRNVVAITLLKTCFDIGFFICCVPYRFVFSSHEKTEFHSVHHWFQKVKNS